MADDLDRTGYFVSIEWDGKTPPTRWYDRLHKLGLKVRGDKETSVMTRRYTESNSGNNRGVIFQEGLIICSSERAANVLASLADEMGAANVLVGTMDVTRYEATREDEITLAKISATWGKRGPKFDANAGTYSVTCLDEGTTHEIDLRDVPVLCPVCSSDHFTYRLGNRPVVTVRHNIDGWWVSRMSSGHFEVPATRYDDDIPDHAPCPHGDIVRAADKIVCQSHISFRNQNDMFLFLDALWIAYTSDPQTRRTRRLAILNRYFSQGGATPYLMISREIDIVDVAAIPCAQSLNLL